MSRRLNIEDVDAALQRAAKKAVGGTREERSGRFQRVQPSIIRFVRYDHDARALEITFMSGQTYRYLNVPVEVYVDFIDAESKGEFFNDNVKDTFVHTAVRAG
jgi:KTSC domain-containing protein